MTTWDNFPETSQSPTSIAGYAGRYLTYEPVQRNSVSAEVAWKRKAVGKIFSQWAQGRVRVGPLCISGEIMGHFNYATYSC